MTHERMTASAFTGEPGTFSSLPIENEGGTINPIWINEFQIETNLYDEATLLAVTGYCEQQPIDRNDMAVSIMGYTVGSGKIDYSAVVDGGLVEVEAIGALRRLKDTAISNSYSDTPILQIIQDVCDKSFVDTFVGGNIIAGGDTTNTNVTMDYRQETAYSIIDALTKRKNWIFYVDVYDRLTIVNSEDIKPQSGLSTARQVVDVGAVVESDPALRRPQYDGVRVVGGSPIDGSEDSRRPISQSIVIGEAGQTGGQNNVLEHIDPTIHTEQFAEDAAKSIFEEDIRARIGGKVKVVGRPDITVFDGIKMPAYLGGSEYLVSSIKHTFDFSSGFETEIETGGLISSNLDIPTSSTTTEGKTTPDDGGGNGNPQEQGPQEATGTLAPGESHTYNITGTVTDYSSDNSTTIRVDGEIPPGLV